MSDFIYSSVSKTHLLLSRCIQSIYHNDPPEVFEYHGPWGSLAVSRNLYNGFQPLETESHLFVVIGGPVLCFTDNLFLTGSDPTRGTQKIYQRWLSGNIQWDEDLSGPFAILIIDKKSLQISCITDLMMFIPVFQYVHDGTVMLGTHVDALARASNQEKQIDLTSIFDFILNDIVTYPHTIYKNIFQSHPAATHLFERTHHGLRQIHPSRYWLPEEVNTYSDINQAATFLRTGLQDYVARVTEGMTEVAQFLSAGEDSRTLAGLLPSRLKRDAFIFVDTMNREGRIAKKVAEAYNENFYPSFREKTHYLDILPEASDLIGSGHQYHHAHALGFHKKSKLNLYDAVFGGFLSDTLLKAHYVKKNKIASKIPWLPHIGLKKHSPVGAKMMSGKYFFTSYSNIIKRQQNHLSHINKMRTKSATEWFYLWPISMHNDVPHIYSNRRIFRSYEIFTCKEVVKVSASIPTSWKLNRRLFHKMARPLLRSSRWIFHADGRLPYFPWWFNSPVQCVIWTTQQICKRTKIIKGNQGPWGDWIQLVKSRKWQEMVSRYRKGATALAPAMNETEIDAIFTSKELTVMQKLNILELLYQLNKRA